MALHDINIIKSYQGALAYALANSSLKYVANFHQSKLYSKNLALQMLHSAYIIITYSVIKWC